MSNESNVSNGKNAKLQEQLIDRVVREVLYQIDKEETGEKVCCGTVVLITSYVPGFRAAVAAIEKEYPDKTQKIKYIGFGGNTLPEGIYGKVENAEELGYSAVLDLVSGKRNVVLLSPKISLLEDIINRRDDDTIAYLIIRSLLWGKNVSLLLDFEPPRFRNNTIFGRVNEILAEIGSVGIEVKQYEIGDVYEDGILELVTERDVRDAYLKEKISIKKAPGAIVTPSAKDAARELNIRID